MGNIQKKPSDIIDILTLFPLKSCTAKDLTKCHLKIRFDPLTLSRVQSVISKIDDTLVTLSITPSGIGF